MLLVAFQLVLEKVAFAARNALCETFLPVELQSRTLNSESARKCLGASAEIHFQIILGLMVLCRIEGCVDLSKMEGGIL
jgi:hypothetical protein